MKDFLKKYSIKNRLFSHPRKLNNILDINLNKISISDILEKDDLAIYYIKCNNNIFYLVIDDVKGYFEKVDDDDRKYNYLTIIFDNEKYEKILKSIRVKIKENKFNEYSREYNVIKFESNDILKYVCIININTVTIIIKSVFKDDSSYYPRIYLDNCSYNYKND